MTGERDLDALLRYMKPEEAMAVLQEASGA